MLLRWLELRDFRSYSNVRWDPVSGANILIGPNGSGKTSVLESVAYLVTGRSFRGSGDGDLVRAGAESAIVRGEFERGESRSLVEVEVPVGGRRRIRINSKAPKRTADLAETGSVVTFLPDDLGLVKGPPSGRRGLLDGLAAQLWPSARLDQTEFDRSLRQRNAYLKRARFGDDHAPLGVWDSRMSQAGGRVMSRRARAAEEFLLRAPEAYMNIAGTSADVGFGYESGWGGTLDSGVPASNWESLLSDALAERRTRDLERRMTTTGPHRDEPVLTLDGRGARHQASQGEQRSLVLSLRLAAIDAITGLTGQAPVLLLDDVFSELDAGRANALLDVLPDVQILVTSARPEEVPLSGKTWHIADGVVADGT